MRVAIGIHGEDIPAFLKHMTRCPKVFFIHAHPPYSMRVHQDLKCPLVSLSQIRVTLSMVFMDPHRVCTNLKVGWWYWYAYSRHSVLISLVFEAPMVNLMVLFPMLRVFNATARYVNQAGRRKGSFAYIEPWHADIMDFLEIRLNQGDEEARCRDLSQPFGFQTSS